MSVGKMFNFKSTLCLLILISHSYGQAQREKISQYTWSSLPQALWDVQKKEHISYTVDVHFHCNGGNKINISLVQLPQNMPPRSPVIIRTQTGYTPPSKKGWMQFIYTAEWSTDRKKLLIHQNNQNMAADLLQLRTQVFENHEMGRQEYQERIQYCQTLKDPQKCVSSSSGYQTGESSIVLEADFGKKKFYFMFDPTNLKDLQQLHCFVGDTKL